MTRKACVIALVAITALTSKAATAGTITTAEIVSQTGTAALSCMRWMPVGLCFWLYCDLTGCEVRTTIKVAHYQPDLVVSSYNTLGGNPWLEIRRTLGLAQQSAVSGLLGRLLAVPVDSAGNRTEGSYGHRDHKNLVFREADAIGHPIASLSGAGVGLTCPSQTRSFFPYFQSALDAMAWRTEIPEMFYPASTLPGLREMGRWPLHTWGGVYPRTGWVTQAEEPKAAAITAQRAGDIVTRRGQPHVYVPVGASSGGNMRVWGPGALVEGNGATGLWQMLRPQPESSCAVFGINDLGSTAGWGGGRLDPGGDYAWNLWRPYTCCRRDGGFIGSIDFVRYP